MSPALIESELFGHERGSFTGAAQRHQGHFERASGGTLFLDEIVEMPIELQARLLRVLESGSLLRVGGETTLETDVRVIAATNRSPEQAIHEGKLRRDLFYRLNVFPILLPALRTRDGDVRLLLHHFLGLLNAAEQSDKIVPPDVIAALERYHWPGNVRQLKNVLQRAFILACDQHEVRPLASLDCADAPSPGTPIVVGESLESLKRQLILTTLAHYRNRRKAAAALGISLKTLYNRLNLYKRSALRRAASEA
jgi:transcriptional regulator with PAS, ATPase and Fis domain